MGDVNTRKAELKSHLAMLRSRPAGELQHGNLAQLKRRRLADNQRCGFEEFCTSARLAEGTWPSYASAQLELLGRRRWAPLLGQPTSRVGK